MGGAHLHRAAASGDRLGRPDDGQGQRYLAGLGPAHLAGAQPSAAPPAHLRSRDPGFAAKLPDIGGGRRKSGLGAVEGLDLALFNCDSTQSSLAWLARHPRWTPSISPNLAFLSQR